MLIRFISNRFFTHFKLLTYVSIRNFSKSLQGLLDVVPGLADGHPYEGVVDKLRASPVEEAYRHANYTKIYRNPPAESKVQWNAAIRLKEAVLTDSWSPGGVFVVVSLEKLSRDQWSELGDVEDKEITALSSNRLPRQRDLL